MLTEIALTLEIAFSTLPCLAAFPHCALHPRSFCHHHLIFICIVPLAIVLMAGGRGSRRSARWTSVNF